MTYYSRDDVLAVFEALDRSGGEWLLLRNTGDELPDRLPGIKDIDVLVRFQNRQAVRKYLYAHGYRRLQHPLRKDIRLYGVHEFEMFRAPSGILLDINFEIAVRSLDRGQWIPLDKHIQTSAWRNRRTTRLGGQSVPILGSEDLFVSTAARCVFDRRSFSDWHAGMLSALLPTCNADELVGRLELVFFRYTDKLLARISAGEFAMIVDDYVSFSEY